MGSGADTVKTDKLLAEIEAANLEHSCQFAKVGTCKKCEVCRKAEENLRTYCI